MPIYNIIVPCGIDKEVTFESELSKEDIKDYIENAAECINLAELKAKIISEKFDFDSTYARDEYADLYEADDYIATFIVEN